MPTALSFWSCYKNNWEAVYILRKKFIVNKSCAETQVTKAKDNENYLYFAWTENTIKLLPKLIINIVCLYRMPTICMPSSILTIKYKISLGCILPQIRLWGRNDPLGRLSDGGGWTTAPKDPLWCVGHAQSFQRQRMQTLKCLPN